MCIEGVVDHDAELEELDADGAVRLDALEGTGRLVVKDGGAATLTWDALDMGVIVFRMTGGEFRFGALFTMTLTNGVLDDCCTIGETC